MFKSTRQYNSENTQHWEIPEHMNFWYLGVCDMSAFTAVKGLQEHYPQKYFYIDSWQIKCNFLTIPASWNVTYQLVVKEGRRRAGPRKQLQRPERAHRREASERSTGRDWKAVSTLFVFCNNQIIILTCY